MNSRRFAAARREPADVLQVGQHVVVRDASACRMSAALTRHSASRRRGAVIAAVLVAASRAATRSAAIGKSARSYSSTRGPASRRRCDEGPADVGEALVTRHSGVLISSTLASAGEPLDEMFLSGVLEVVTRVGLVSDRVDEVRGADRQIRVEVDPRARPRRTSCRRPTAGRGPATRRSSSSEGQTGPPHGRDTARRAVDHGGQAIRDLEPGVPLRQALGKRDRAGQELLQLQRGRLEQAVVTQPAAT